MPFKLKNSFNMLLQGPFNIYDAYLHIASMYTEKKKKLLEDYKKVSGFSSLKWITFNAQKVESDVKLIESIPSILNIKPRNKDKIIHQLKLKQDKFHDEEVRNLIKTFIQALKSGKSPVCCSCGKIKPQMKICTICNNKMCLSDIKIGNTTKLLLSPRIKKNYSNQKHVICPKCDHFSNKSLTVMKQFMDKIYNKYDYFILGHQHIFGACAGTSFLYQLINNHFLDNIVAFAEIMHIESKYKNYTDNDKMKSIFVNQLMKYNKNLKECHGIANILELYTSNEFVYSASNPELDALTLACYANKVPLYSFDNDKISIFPAKTYYKDRQIVNKIIATRILRESSRHPNAKVFIPIGGNHIYGENALQQYLPNCCTITCTTGVPYLSSYTPNSHYQKKPKAQLPNFCLSWHNIFLCPFLPLKPK
ncbi:MAG: hypothetical protein GY750_08265 [Lentisphaerae bacterium]|nr:hypothetical protein [Lentisphaerota bacterium]MCP4101403.1 hypothetical protein [Lentisphaerota bacterium]